SLLRLEDAGASAVVLPSLFEEQFERDSRALHYHMTTHADIFAEAQSFFPEPDVFHMSPDRYLERIREARERLQIPVVASLNGNTVGGWTDYAAKMEEAGANALELNIYSLETDPYLPSQQIEEEYLKIVRSVREAVSVPLAVKIGPFFANIAYMARQLSLAGANGLVLFNRFYQPDIELSSLTVRQNLKLSTSIESRLAMTWIGILFGRVECDLAATGGIHTGEDALKALMAGASATTLASALLIHGPQRLSQIEAEMRGFMEEYEYESVEQLRGSMSQINCPDPNSYERAQYISMITSYHLQE
ncbi:MAG: dihydroorotate dehydrogenase-like protein, partial [Myxococcales bacterium]|nr:dihydroorotate dehydrogenase-like protein [Myxococcales bacterium]